MSDIRLITTRIHKTEAAVTQELEKREAALTRLGRALHQAGLASDIPEAAAAADKIEEIRELEESLRSFLSDQERRGAAADERKALNVESRNIRNRRTELHETLGRASWSMWKSNRNVDNLETALGELIKAESRLHTAEDAAYRSERNPSSPSSILSRGRTLLLASRRKTASAALERLMAKAGARVMELVEPQALEDTPAMEAAAALASLKTREQEILARREELSREEKTLDAALEELPGKGGIRRRGAWIERQLDELRGELDEALGNLAEWWLESRSSETGDTPPGVKKHTEELTDIDERIDRLESRVSALEAHRELKETEEKRTRQAAAVDSLDAEIKKRQANLKNARKTLASIDKQLENIRKTLPPLPEDTVD